MLKDNKRTNSVRIIVLHPVIHVIEILITGPLQTDVKIFFARFGNR